MSRFLCLGVKIGILIFNVKKLHCRASTRLFYSVLLEKQTTSSSLASLNCDLKIFFTYVMSSFCTKLLIIAFSVSFVFQFLINQRKLLRKREVYSAELSSTSQGLLETSRIITSPYSPNIRLTKSFCLFLLCQIKIFRIKHFAESKFFLVEVIHFILYLHTL